MKSTFQILFAVYAALLPATTLAANSCDLSAVKTYPLDPYGHCQADAHFYDDEYSACAATGPLLVAGGIADRLVRREQIKFILAQDLFNASRIPPSSKFYESVWAEIHRRWHERLDPNREIMALDADPHLGADQCNLHHMLGEDCAGLPALDMIDLQRQRALNETRARAAAHPYPMGLAYDLVGAVLLLESVKPRFWDVLRGANFKARQGEAQAGIRNYVFNYYPELALDGASYTRVFNLLTSPTYGSLLMRAYDRLRAADSGDGVELDRRTQIIDELMGQTFGPHPLAKDLQDHLEEDFGRAQMQVTEKLDRQLRLAVSDKAWLFQQDYLLLAVMRASRAWNQKTQGPLMQTLLCHNYLEQGRMERRKQTAELIGGTAALFTGVGMMLDLAGLFGTACVVSTFGIMNTMSMANLYTFYQASQNKQNLFVVRGASYVEVSDAEAEFRGQIPWSLLNLALMSPGVVLPKLAAARALASEVGDVARVEALDRYRKLITRALTLTGFGFAGDNSFEAYKVIRDSMPKPD